MSRIFNQKGVDVSASDGYIGTINAYRLLEVLNQWHAAQKQQYACCHFQGYVSPNFDSNEEKHAHISPKYTRLDTGTSGAWMMENATGLIFSIHGYGKVDRKKCVGNINNPEFNGSVLFRDRWRRGPFNNTKAVV